MKPSLRLLVLTGTLITCISVAWAARPAVSSPIAPDHETAETLRFAQTLRDMTARELDLTPSQQLTIRTIVQTHQTAIATQVDAHLAAQRHLREVVINQPDDDLALQQAADEVGSTHRNLALATARLRADLRLTLTPSQLTQIDAWHQRLDHRLTVLRQRLSTFFAQPS